MKKVLIGIFAHPDDEAFGPSGSLYQAAHNDIDVHLVLATKGDAGRNCDDCDDLGAVRLKEWQASGELIGVSSQHFLDYKDGTLCNNLYLEIADKILKIIKDIIGKHEESIELELLTFDQNGLSGHLDHVAISFITTYVYEKLKERPLTDVTLGRLRYYCVCENFAPAASTDWIYMAAGRSKADVDEVIDISRTYERKLAIMQTHKSQREDMEMILERYGSHPSRFEECFIIYK